MPLNKKLSTKFRLTVEKCGRLAKYGKFSPLFLLFANCYAIGNAFKNQICH